MAIDIIPGVGPTNADIATAVAAPSAASIAAAVAAPSSATIASAVAAAVPTSANITSIVQANAGSPFAGSWTNLGVLTSTSQNASFTGLSSYKYLRFSFWVYHDSAGINPYVRFNNDSSALYTLIAPVSHTGNTSSPQPLRSLTATELSVQLSENSAGQYYQMNLEIFGAQSGAYKTFKGCNYYINSNLPGGTFAHQFDGTWRSTNAISSVSFISNRSTNNNWTIYAQGAN